MRAQGDLDGCGQGSLEECNGHLGRGMRMKSLRLPARRAVGAVVLPAERDAGVVGCNEASVRDGDTVGVAGEIAQHLSSTKNRFATISTQSATRLLLAGAVTLGLSAGNATTRI